MKKDNNKIAILITTFDNEKTINKCIDSLLVNTRPPDTIIIGDNDSKDQTYELLCKKLNIEMIKVKGQFGWPPKFETKINDTKIIIFRSRKNNVPVILNAAIGMLTKDHDIIGFIDSKDIWLENKIIESINIFNRDPSVACIVSDALYKYDKLIRRTYHESFKFNNFLYDNNIMLRSTIFGILKCAFNNNLEQMFFYDLLNKIWKVGLIYHIPKALHCHKPQPLTEQEKQIKIIIESNKNA